MSGMLAVMELRFVVARELSLAAVLQVLRRAVDLGRMSGITVDGRCPVDARLARESFASSAYTDLYQMQALQESQRTQLYANETPPLKVLAGKRGTRPRKRTIRRLQYVVQSLSDKGNVTVGACRCCAAARFGFGDVPLTHGFTLLVRTIPLHSAIVLSQFQQSSLQSLYSGAWVRIRGLHSLENQLLQKSRRNRQPFRAKRVDWP